MTKKELADLIDKNSRGFNALRQMALSESHRMDAEYESRLFLTSELENHHASPIEAIRRLTREEQKAELTRATIENCRLFNASVMFREAAGLIDLIMSTTNEWIEEADAAPGGDIAH